MEIDANGTTTIGGDLFNDSGDKTTANPTGFVFNMLDGDTRGIQFFQEVQLTTKVEMVNALVK